MAAQALTKRQARHQKARQRTADSRPEPDLIWGRHPVLEALRGEVPLKRVLTAEGIREEPIVRDIRDAAADRGVVVSTVPRRQIEQMTRGGNHQGIVAEAYPFEYADASSLYGLDPCRLVLLDGITDPANLGSILRTMEAFGWSGVLVPRHRNVAVTPAVRKVAAGAADRVPVAQVGSPADTALRLTKEGFLVAGLDPDGDIVYTDESLKVSKLCLVLGAEGPGLSPLVRRRCDVLVRIPMQGSLASLNVAVSAAIVISQTSKA